MLRDIVRHNAVRNADSYPKQLVSELQRRRVFRTAALYIVGAWLAVQVADVTFPAMDIPERAIRYVLLAAIIGFPAILIFGWFYDVGVDGIRRTPPAGSGSSVEAKPLRRSDYVILTAFLFVAGAIVYNATVEVADERLAVIERDLNALPVIAVLPFASKSIEGESEFFAVGVHDDLLTQLANLQSMRVISRTSVLEYKDTTRNIREIGRALGADAILEGGVQSAGSRIRINAQLIDARTDEHLWARTYDRELSTTSIFDVQTEIARTIATSLQATLTTNDTEQLTTLPTENMAAYRAFRRSKEIYDDQSLGYPSYQYLEALEEAIALDPEFLRAKVELVGRLSYETFFEDAPAAAERAGMFLEELRLQAPNSAEYLIAQAYYTYYTLKDSELAYGIINRAQEMRPNDLGLLELKSWIERRLGNFAGRHETMVLAEKLDPNNPRWIEGIVNSLYTQHRYAEAEAELETAKLDTYFLALLRSSLGLRHDRDFGRYVEDVKQAQQEFGTGDEFDDLWYAQIANRDFESALAIAESLPDSRESRRVFRGDIVQKDFLLLLTFWLMGDKDKMNTLAATQRENLEATLLPNGEFENYRTNFGMAALTALSGNSELTELYARKWRRGAAGNHTQLSAGRAQICGLLGMSGAAQATVACLRDAFVQPSDAAPFVDPYLPFYDPVRDSPEFTALLEELGESP